jgi:mannosyl-3-phosphoglycerate phosphatase
MGGSRILGVSDIPFYLIFTDLDGTLLDHNTYEWEEAIPALNLCEKLKIPVILTSSKTRAEMDNLRLKLSISAPFISENGGGIFSPSEAFEDPPPGASLVASPEGPLPQRDSGLWKWSLGMPYTRLIKELREIRKELGWYIRGFSDMSIEEISDLTGLDRQTSRLAAMREYDEPFIVLEEQRGDRSALFRAAEQRGLTVTVGGRFYHLHGRNDKGEAMGKVVSWYKQSHGEVASIALGDSPNDFAMLERADYPVLIRSQNDFPTLKKKIPRLRVTREMGPTGWNSAVWSILGKKEEAADV